MQIKLGVLDLLNSMHLLAQSPTAGDAAPAMAGADAVGNAAKGGTPTGAPTDSLLTQILGNPMNLILISGILFVLLVLRPQQKQMKELQNSLSSLKKNDRIITSSGIHGTVVQANSGESTVVVRIDENSGARVTLNRDAIAKILSDDKDDAPTK